MTTFIFVICFQEMLFSIEFEEDVECKMQDMTKWESVCISSCALPQDKTAQRADVREDKSDLQDLVDNHRCQHLSDPVETGTVPTTTTRLVQADSAPAHEQALYQSLLCTESEALPETPPCVSQHLQQHGLAGLQAAASRTTGPAPVRLVKEQALALNLLSMEVSNLLPTASARAPSRWHRT